MLLGTLLKIVLSDKPFHAEKLLFNFLSPQKSRQMMKYYHVVGWIQINIVLEVGKGKRNLMASAGVTRKNLKTLHSFDTVVKFSFNR